jgi:hypothetical protein
MERVERTKAPENYSSVKINYFFASDFFHDSNFFDLFTVCLAFPS